MYKTHIKFLMSIDSIQKYKVRESLKKFKALIIDIAQMVFIHTTISPVMKKKITDVDLQEPVLLNYERKNEVNGQMLRRVSYLQEYLVEGICPKQSGLQIFFN